MEDISSIHPPHIHLHSYPYPPPPMYERVRARAHTHIQTTDAIKQRLWAKRTYVCMRQKNTCMYEPKKHMYGCAKRTYVWDKRTCLWMRQKNISMYETKDHIYLWDKTTYVYMRQNNICIYETKEHMHVWDKSNWQTLFASSWSHLCLSVCISYSQVDKASFSSYNSTMSCLRALKLFTMLSVGMGLNSEMTRT